MNTIDTILKIAKVKDIDSFYKKFPSEEAFMAKYGKEFKKAMKGAKVPKAQDGFDISGKLTVNMNDWFNNQHIGLSKEDQLKLSPIQTTPFQKMDFMSGTVQTGTNDNGVGDAISSFNPIAGGIIKGIQQLKEEKERMLEAKQWRDVTGVQLQASNLKPERIERKYLRPEDFTVTGEEMFPTYGTGSNVLAKDGIYIKPSKRGTFTAAAKKRGKGVQEFAKQVMANKDNYSPAMVKKANFAKNASKWKKANDGAFLESIDINQLNNISETLTGGESGGGTIGGAVGEAVSYIPGVGPIVSKLAKPVLTAVGNILDTRPERTEAYMKQTGRNISNMLANKGVKGVHGLYSGSMEDGGVMGGNNLIPLEGNIKRISYNPFIGETVQLEGPSHERGGMLVAKADNGMDISDANIVEAEGGETATDMKDGSTVIYGDLYVPGSRKKFKTVAEDISKKEEKQSKLIKMESKKLERLDVQNPLDKLELETHKLNIRGATMKQKELAQEKEHLASLQEAINQTADEQNLDASALAEGKIRKAKKSSTAKYGIKIKAEESDRIYERDDNALQRRLNYLKGMWQNSPHSEMLRNLYNNTVGLMDYEGDYVGGVAPAVGGVKGVAKGASKTISKQLLKEQQIMANLVKAPGGLSKQYPKGVPKQPKLTGSKPQYQIINGKMYEVPVNNPTNIPWKEIGGAAALGLGAYGLLQLGDQEQEYINYPSRTIPDFNQKYDFYPPYDGQEEQEVNQLISVERPAVDSNVTSGGTTGGQRGTGSSGRKSTSNTSNNKGMVVAPDVELEEIPIDDKMEMIQTKDPTLTVDNLPTKNNKFEWFDALSSLVPYFKGSDVEDLDPSQIMGELAALSDRPEPVWAQTIQPDLASPYEISLQDQKNEVIAQSRAAQRMAGNNPAAQAIIAAQTSDALNKIQGEEFRINQGMKDKTFGENRERLNQTRFQNLQILDNLYTRQEQAKSKTKETLRNALNSISDKYLKNRFENKTLAIYENLYDYRFDDKGRAWYRGRPASFNMEGGDSGMRDNRGLREGEEYLYDSRGEVVDIRRVPRDRKKKESRNGAIVKSTKSLTRI